MNVDLCDVSCVPKERPQLSKCLCAFIDILGLSHFIEKATAIRESQSYFDMYYDCVGKEIVRVQSEYSNSTSIQMRSFTDNIVLGIQTSPDNIVVNLAKLVKCVSEIQANFARVGFFSRGGISYEKLYINEYFAFGKALLDAYRIEQRVVNPRVVLSDPVRSHVDSDAHKDKLLDKMNLFIDTDNKVYVNYMASYVSDSQKNTVDDIMQHKKYIEKGLRDFSEQVAIQSKYLWLVNYHNTFASTCLGNTMLNQNRKLLINKSTLRIEPSQYYPKTK